MENKNILHFELLGAFSCGGEEEKTKNGAVISKSGKKALSFLQYLIVNHGRNISSEELIERFWADPDSSNPSGALRNMLFKIRNLLKTIFPEQDNLLLTLQDCYAWNPEVCFELDTEQLETLCRKAKRARGEECCDLLCQAVSLYKGDFLAGNDTEWARPLRQYYQTLYLDACRAVLPLLYKKEEWMKLISICSQAYAVDFGLEDFTAYQMQAFIALGQPGQAVEIYETFRARLLQEYEMLPTERLERLHILAEGLGKNGMDEQDILRMICEEDPDTHAFLCTFSTFQSIVALERRHMERSGVDSTLVIISLDSGAVPSTDGRRLERILVEKLRTGDPIARLEADTYILLLSGANMENARLVVSRIDTAFHRTYRHSGAKLSFRLSDLKPLAGAVSGKV